MNIKIGSLDLYGLLCQLEKYEEELKSGISSREVTKIVEGIKELFNQVKTQEQKEREALIEYSGYREKHVEKLVRKQIGLKLLEEEVELEEVCRLVLLDTKELVNINIEELLEAFAEELSPKKTGG